jgi:hypothetical protein
LAEIDGFESIICTLLMAKDLHDIGRFDIVENCFSDELCWDYYYEAIMGVTQNIFFGFDSIYGEDDESELMFFSDSVMSDYFVKAHEFGVKNKIPHVENPYVIKAEKAVCEHLNISHCVDFKLLAYTKTKRTARKSQLLVSIYHCGCAAPEYVAYGLIQLYKFFSEEVNGVPVPADAPLPGQLSLEDCGKELAA